MNNNFNMVFTFLYSVILLTACGSAAPPQDAEPLRVLIVGGHDHHDFDRWFDEADTETLEAIGADVNYTDVPRRILPALEDVDVLYLSNNQPLPGDDLREGIFNHVNAGKGLLIVHAAGWYSWNDWPEFNRDLVGGGTRSHPPYGEIEVRVTEPGHPIMEGVSETFRVEDELYRFEKDPDGPPIQVLAIAEDLEGEESYPAVWIVEHSNGRIVVNTLGHDGEAHAHPDFQQILQNSALWAGRRLEQ